MAQDKNYKVVSLTLNLDIEQDRKILELLNKQRTKSVFMRDLLYKEVLKNDSEDGPLSPPESKNDLKESEFDF